MPEFVQDPQTYVLLLLVGTLLWVFRKTINGNFVDIRVVNEKNSELDALKAANAELSKQNGYLLHELGPLVANVMVALKESKAAQS